ncbi:MAG TPA: hypothetical protein VMH88_12755 [Gemmatimonadales bacterium]|nr:hypothetical protein [Gemmatimonadales bacterium]
MQAGWQDTWTFRIVDQDTGAAISGIPVTVLDDGGRSEGFWVSDANGVIRIPKHDRGRLRLRVGLRSEDTIELDARSLPDEAVPLAAPHGLAEASGGSEPSSVAVASPELVPGGGGSAGGGGHVLRFARIGVLPSDAELVATRGGARESQPDPVVDGATLRYGVLFEVEQIWQSLGTESGDLLYSVSLAPGEEVKLAVSDGRWRRKTEQRERPFQIVGRMVAAQLVGDGVEALPLDPIVTQDLPAAAEDTVRVLAQRTARMSESLRRRPVSVTELEDEKPAGASIRTVRNLRAEGVLTYHFVEPVERYRVIVRTPRLRPAILVPFRLPNLATRDVVRRYGHALRRALLDRALLPDIEAVLADESTPDAEQRLFGHVAKHLAYYSATIIAAGDPDDRFYALSKIRDIGQHPLTDLIENVVAGRVGNYVAFPLRAVEFMPPEWQAVLSEGLSQRLRAYQEAIVSLPIPGVWLRSQLSPSTVDEAAHETDHEESGAEGRSRRKRRGASPG